VAVRELPSGTVTFLFTDIEGSTRLLDRLGSRAYARSLAQHRRVMRKAFAVHGGVEVDTQGDAFFVAFTDASQALAAAQEAQGALAEDAVSVRMGLHTGEPLLTEEGYVGADIHKAARICSASHGGQVLLSQETRERVAVEVIDLGEHRLKDFAEPIWIFQLGDSEFPPLKTISNTNLPRPASSFVGREKELEQVAGLLQGSTRLLTLTGPGGSGKTRLALEAAAELVREFRAGVFWVGLAPLRDPALVIQSIAQTLGAKDGLAEHIGERELLVLLDNLEQVVESGPELASLIETCPNLRLMVTSRELLRVRGEVEYVVLPLAEPEAVNLFCERAGTEPEESVHQLCRALDNLPLALELAAARANVLSPAQLLERLSDRLDQLKGGRDADPRQQTLRSAIDWSHELLDADEQRLFARLAVFSGGCMLDAAQQVADADLDTLQSLVHKSLLRHTDERFWMLETIREYAEERFEEIREAAQIRDRHANLFIGLASAAGAELVGPNSAETVEVLDREHTNIRAAFRWAVMGGEQSEALAAFSGMWRYLELRGHGLEGMRWFDEAQTAADSPVSVKLEALRGAANLTRHLGQVSRTEELANQMLALAQRVDDVRMTGIAVAILGTTAVFTGDFEGGMARLKEARPILRKAGDDVALGRVLSTLSYAALAMGDCPGASSFAQESRVIAERVGDDIGKTLALSNLGLADLLQGSDEGAEALFVECLTCADEIGFTDSVSYAYEGLAAVAVRRQVGVRAARLLGAAESLRQATRMSLDFVERGVHEEVVEQLHEMLSPDQVAAEWAAGRDAAPAEIVAYAMSARD
jgi:predicted ATPase